jgi:nitrite reductase/ring-hydroxylating ferredoxin subunit
MGQWLRICESDFLKDGGQGFSFSYTHEGKTVPAFVVRYGRRVFAYLNRCAHVPVRLESQPDTFFDFSGQFLICAMHGALYDPRTGRCIGGRCTGFGHLVPVSVKEETAEVWIWQENQGGAHERP